MEESLSFYVTVLGFELKSSFEKPTSPVINLTNGEAELQLSVLAGDGVFGSAVNIEVDEVDDLFETFASAV